MPAAPHRNQCCIFPGRKGVVIIFFHIHKQSTLWLDFFSFALQRSAFWFVSEAKVCMPGGQRSLKPMQCFSHQCGLEIAFSGGKTRGRERELFFHIERQSTYDLVYLSSPYRDLLACSSQRRSDVCPALFYGTLANLWQDGRKA